VTPNGCDDSGLGAVVRELPHASVRRNLLLAVLGNGLLNLCRFGVMVVLTNFATAEIAGSFHFAAIALSAPVVMFFGLELRAAFVADVRHEFPFGAYRALRWIGMLAAAPILVGVVLWVFRAEASTALILMMLAVCGGRIAFQLAEVEWGLMQRHERFDIISGSNALRGILMIVPFAVLIPWAAAVAEGQVDADRRLEFAAAGAAGVYLLCWLGIWWFVDRRYAGRHAESAPDWRPAVLRRLAAQTLPMGLVILILALCEGVPAWFIHRGHGLTDVGYYGALRVITLGAGFLIVQLGNAAGNRLAITYRTDLSRFVRLAARLTLATGAIGGAIVGLTWFYGEAFLRFVYPEAYAAHHLEFFILVAAQAIFLLGSIFGFVTTHMRRFWVQVPVQLTILLVTIVASYLLIPDDPVRGAAWTAVARAIAQAVLYLGCVVGGVRAARLIETKPRVQPPDSH
jgi:O-antigen/teichoic acid export membrane protein